MKKSISKKIIAVMVTVLMLVSLVPTAFAEDNTFTVTTPETIDYGENIEVKVEAPLGTALDFYLDDALVETVASTTAATTTKNITSAKLGTLCVDVVATFKDGTSKTISKNIKVVDYLKNTTTYVDWSFDDKTDPTKVKTSYFNGVFQISTYNKIVPTHVETAVTSTTPFALGKSGVSGDKALPFIVKPKEAGDNRYPSGTSSSSSIGYVGITSGSKADCKKIIKTGNTMVFEYDLMLTKVSDYIIKMGIYNTYFSIIDSGSVYSTKEALSDGQWVKVKVEVEYPSDGEKGELSAYVNDKLVTTKNDIPNYDFNTKEMDELKICFDKKTAWGEEEIGKDVTVFAVDNLKHYVLAPTPTYEFDKTVSVNSDSASVIFNGLKFVDTTITSDSVSLYVDNEKVSADVSYDSAANKITLTPQEGSLKAFSKGKILISDDAKIQTMADGRISISDSTKNLFDIELPLNHDMEINFVISDENNHYYEVTKTGNKATYKLINGNDNPFMVKTILAGYDDKCLSKLWFNEASIEKGGKSIWTRELDGVSSTKAMFWTTDNKPLTLVK